MATEMKPWTVYGHPRGKPRERDWLDYVNAYNAEHARYIAREYYRDYVIDAVLRVTGGHRLLRCAVCDQPFFTSAWQALYCSDRCRHTAQKRHQRQRQRERRMT